MGAHPVGEGLDQRRAFAVAGAVAITSGGLNITQSLSGASLQIGGTGSVNLGGQTNVTGAISVSGGSLTVGAAMSGSSLQINDSGSVNLNAAVTVS